MKVSIVLTVFNASDVVEDCLKSIREQDFPQKNIEILMVDGGSTDNTIEIGKRYNCKIYNNPDRLAEPGVAIALEKSKGDIIFVIDADNRLPAKDWLKRMLRPFKDPKIMGVFTHVIVDKSHNALNRYMALMHSSPFIYFVFGRKVDPRKMPFSYRILEKNRDYVVFDFNEHNYPSVAFGQGTCIRKDIPKEVFEKILVQERRDHDDVAPFVEMMKLGKVAYVPTGIIHLHVTGFKQMLRKYRQRILNVFNKQSYGVRREKMSGLRKFKELLWPLYSLTIVWPLIDAFREAFEDRDLAWLLHPIVCLFLTALTVSVALDRI